MRGRTGCGNWDVRQSDQEVLTALFTFCSLVELHVALLEETDSTDRPAGS